MDLYNDVWLRFWHSFVNSLPNFFTGLVILVLGLVVANALKRLLLSLFAYVKFDNLLQRAKLLERGEVRLWEEVIAEIVRWSVTILFLVPTLEVWGLSRATELINQFIYYLPNIIVAVVIGFVGLIFANLTSDLVLRSVKTMGATSAKLLAAFAKSAVTFFTVLVVLNQLGVAQDLVRILFTGIVGMLALAGGLAFGLGGKEHARNVLDSIQKKVK